MKSTTWLTVAQLRAILGTRVGGGTPTCGQIAYLQQEEIACVNT